MDRLRALSRHLTIAHSADRSVNGRFINVSPNWQMRMSRHTRLASEIDDIFFEGSEPDWPRAYDSARSIEAICSFVVLTHFTCRYQGVSMQGRTSTRPHRPAGSSAPRARGTGMSAVRPSSNGFQNAQRSYERYLALAQEEARSGNVVAAENYYQHAEHHFRVMSSNRAAT